MTTYDYGAGAPTGTDAPTGGSSGDAKEQVQQAASTAAEEGKHVAETAMSEAQSVAEDAKEQVRNLADDARSQIEDQSRSQLESLVSTLQGFADDLERMARGEGAGAGLARDVVTQVSEKAKTFSSQLQGREPAEVLDQARDFARRRPGTFLLGALAAGVVAGRLTRGAKDAQSGTSTDQRPATAPVTDTATATSTLPTGTAADEPLAGTGTPAPGAVYPEGSGPAGGGTL